MGLFGGHGEEIVLPAHATQTIQVDYGWAPPQSPGASQRFNIYRNVQAPALNPAGSFMQSKPRGYDQVTVQTWFKTSDPLADGEVIEMDLKLGQFTDDLGPAMFFGQAMLLGGTPFNATNYKKWKRYTLFFPGFSSRLSSELTLWVERRNDLSNIAPEVWELKNDVSFQITAANPEVPVA